MPAIGCYTLHLYCDNDRRDDLRAPDGVHVWNEFPHEYTDEYGSKCRSEARRDGWILGKRGAALCPKCSGKAPAAQP